MSDIQKLIDKIVVRQKSHWKKFIKAKDHSKEEIIHISAHSECDFFIHKLTLLLKTERRKDGKDCDKK